MQPEQHCHDPLRTKRQGTDCLDQYCAVLFAVVGLLTLSMVLVRVRSGFAYPEWFFLFRALLRLQFGLFGGAILAALLYLLPKIRAKWLGALGLGLFYLCFVWALLWGFVQRVYGIELTLGNAIDLFANPAVVGAMVGSAWEVVLITVALLALIAVLTAMSLRLANRAGQRLRRRGFLVFSALFLFVHIPVRAYFVYHTNRNHSAALAYDNCAPFPLQSERLAPAWFGDPISLPDLESKERTVKYLKYLRTLPTSAIPRPRNILWINVEALRFDAIEEHVMPRLSAYQNQFQIRLNRQHWSGGNVTQSGVFSMMTGLSGYHFIDLRRAAMKNPFLELLGRNGYRLRVANKNYIRYGDLDVLLPPQTICSKVDVDPIHEGDRRAVDSYLADRTQRDAAVPAFDFVPLEATHWPYGFSEDHALFQPAPLLRIADYTFRLNSERDLVPVRNRYRNSCHFIDEQIGRVLDDLRTRGGFDNTIVIVVGDHGEEFLERGQVAHAAILNDYQARTALWIHLPDAPPESLAIEVPTVHMDIVPTILEALGFSEDVLYTQGRSLLGHLENRSMLSLCEEGSTTPLYRALVTDTYISRWRHSSRRYLFAGVQRRDGAAVEGEEWLREARELAPAAAEMYELLPDVEQPPRKFTVPTSKAIENH